MSASDTPPPIPLGPGPANRDGQADIAAAFPIVAPETLDGNPPNAPVSERPSSTTTTTTAASPNTADAVPVATDSSSAAEVPCATEAPCAAPNETPRGLLKMLEAEFPVFRDHLPLAIGIDKALIQRKTEISKKLLRIALSLHTRTTRYLRAAAKATHRFDLDGNPVAELNEEHRQHAAETLRERLKKQAELRRANAPTEAPASRRPRPDRKNAHEKPRATAPEVSAEAALPTTATEKPAFPKKSAAPKKAAPNSSKKPAPVQQTPPAPNKKPARPEQRSDAPVPANAEKLAALAEKFNRR